ncbi:basic leucine zipper 9 isoform X2 [Diospyros lotus]|uniref:basic leucine zipper 9 isoform X2 n=1 Tax=Diospyros lotus TaxID=55363 RepID=UPI00224EC948|nr:basic leucine zipper 9 isoform X2 [Diospyros lotus]
MDEKKAAVEDDAAAAMIFGGGDMKRIPSELALEELFSKKDHGDQDEEEDRDEEIVGEIRAQISQGSEAKSRSSRSKVLFAHGHSFDPLLSNLLQAQLPFPSTDRVMNDFSSYGGLTDTNLWCESVTSKQSGTSVPIGSQSSMCDNQATGATSNSSHEQSDDDDMDTEAGIYKKGTDTIDMKRIKRMVSNRESARRSRRRKQAQLAELELQVEQLRGENASLLKQLTGTTQQFKDAATNNRVLKSDVEALRAKVKLAEDMVTRGSLTSSLSNLLQNHLSTPQSTSSHKPTMAVHGEDALYTGMTKPIELESPGAFNDNVKNGILSDGANCSAENWTWVNRVPTVSK